MGGLNASSMKVEGAALIGSSGVDAMTISEAGTKETEAGIDEGAPHAHELPSQQGILCGAGSLP